MHRFSPIVEFFLSKRQIFLPSSQLKSRFDLIQRSFHVSKALEDNFRRSNGIGLVCLEKSNNDRTKNSKYDEFASDVEKSYRILRKFHSRVPKLELALNESGVQLRPGLIERVLSRCGDAGNLGYRFFVWAAKQPGYSHTIEVYKSMVRVLSKMRQFGSVWGLIEEMRKENPQLIGPELFLVLVQRFPSAVVVKKAIEVLDEMPKFGLEHDEYVFGCLLDALCKHGSVKDAAKLFEDMRLRFPSNLRYFNSLLYGWCKEGKMMEAKHVLVQMKEAGFEPDIVDYTNLLSGYANAGKIADAYDLLKDMRRSGFEPNVNCYTVLIQGLCKVDRMEEAMKVFVEMEMYECEADVVTYTSLVNGFCKCGRIDKCYVVLDDMIKKGLIPCQLTYMYIMATLEKKEKFEECLEMMEKMKQIGYYADLGVYNIVIRLACKLGEVKEALRLWNEMKTNGLSPGADSFVIMIDGLTSQGNLLEASDHFKEMVTRGLFSVSQYKTLKSLLNTLLRDEKLETAKDVWSCISSKGSCELTVSSWTIWIHALFSKGYEKEACSYCLEMMEMDFMPQPDTFGKLMKGLKKLYNREFAAEITEKVRNMAFEREMSFKMYKRRGVQDLTEKAKSQKEGKKKQRTQ
ncbi:PREDICTED: putative pentatricopeptide repeat-containing protein At5g65820 [Camelina sativa]|uniref:Pentatricopeptide repeat-containing protein At5g65820 n=1 Tax=Camelina sativa TaxID=90675 RepID=A0ABM0VZL7_CAMSA|nr:PREDICTED: putative pentatricopeptide repeat-containing protein At5g65820 [Camelina sativa]XP_010463642.1 PREDICTED: putative pentatricopeptide repeat-containing protein At5g65820 [Camelina sativa]